MAIIPDIITPNPPIAVVGQPVRIGLTIINSEASPITVTGIEIFDANGVLEVGDFSPALPAKFQFVSGGTAVTSSIPSLTAQYYFQNVSGSSYVSVQTSGSYGGNNTNFTPQSSSYIIPAGATGSYQVAAVARNINLNNSYAAGGLAVLGVASLKARVSVSGSVATYDDNGNNNMFIFDMDGINGAQITPVDQPLVVVGSEFARPPQYSDFDAMLQTDLQLVNGATFTIPPFVLARTNYSSSDPSVISVVAEGAYGSTTPITSAYSTSVGSFYQPIAGQTTKLTAGGGAITYHFINDSDPSVGYATITNEIAAGLTASIELGRTDITVKDFIVEPSQVSIVSGSTANIYAYYITNNGQTVPANGNNNIPQPTWTSNSTAVAVNVSGTITGSANVQANVQIKAEGLAGLFAVSNVTLNYKP